MEFDVNRLIEIRKSLGINKAEAARMLNMSAMGYGRYENGDRTPSYQTISFMANKFGTTTEYLLGTSDDPKRSDINVSPVDNPELFELVAKLKNDESMTKRLLAYLTQTDT